MSFQPPSSKQENQNRKILEELQKKQQALKQPSANLTSIKSSSIKPQSNQTTSPTFNQLEFNHLNNPHSNGHQREKIALQYALQNSFGNFISQDSSFGNQIIPVLPY